MLALGKSYIDDYEFVAAVAAGGRYGPGELRRFDGIRWQDVRIVIDNRSNSLKSKAVRFDVSEPGIYHYVGIAVSNRLVAQGYFEHTADGKFVELKNHHDRLIELYPDVAVSLEADRLRLQREAHERLQRERDLQRERMLREVQTERDSVWLKRNGVQLPKLIGTRKQVRSAEHVRTDWAMRSPNAPQLRTETSARWWIEFAANGSFTPMTAIIASVWLTTSLTATRRPHKS
jgi:hypothetical protein